MTYRHRQAYPPMSLLNSRVNFVVAFYLLITDTEFLAVKIYNPTSSTNYEELQPI